MKRLLRLTALALGLTLLLSACGHKNTEPERKDAATQTVPVEGITGLTLCDGDVTLRFEKDEEGRWFWHDDPPVPLEQSTMDELLAIFRRHGEHVHVEALHNGEFDWLVYFEDGKPDAYCYCIADEGCHLTYHRFTKEDYEAFGFETT